MALSPLHFIVTFLLVGCSEEGDAPAKEAATTTEAVDDPIDPFTQMQGDPILNPSIDGFADLIDHFVELIDQGLSSGLPNVIDYRNEYRSFMIHRDEDCPAFEGGSSDTTEWVGVWFSNSICISDDGYQYFGLALYHEEQAASHELDLNFGMLASYELTDEDGSTFFGGGGINFGRIVDDDDVIIVNSFLGGSYRYPASSTLLADGTESSLFIDATASGDDLDLVANGGVGLGALYLYFYETSFSSSTCDFMPQGRVGIRDENGYWFDLEMTGCEPCAKVGLDGHVVGEACVGETIRDAMYSLAQRSLYEMVDP